MANPTGYALGRPVLRIAVIQSRFKLNDFEDWRDEMEQDQTTWENSPGTGSRD